MPNTKDFMPIEKVVENLVMLKDGSITMVLQTSAVNFDLLSENEQLAIIGSFAAFLNSLSFSIQILIRSKKLDISHYLNTLRAAESKQNNPLLQLMMQRYRAFVAAIIRDNEVLDKQFYVIISVSPIEVGVVSSSNYEKNLPKALNILEPRRDHILKQLSRIGLKSTQLDNERLIKLFYDIYNDEDKVSLSDVQGNPANRTAQNTQPVTKAAKIISPTPVPSPVAPPKPQPPTQLSPKPEIKPLTSVEQTPAQVVAQAQASNQLIGSRKEEIVGTQQTSPPRPPLYSSTNSRQAPFVVEELPA